MLLFCWPGIGECQTGNLNWIAGPWPLRPGQRPATLAGSALRLPRPGGAFAVRAKLGSSSCSAGQHGLIIMPAWLLNQWLGPGHWGLVGGLSHQQALLWDSYKIQSGALAVRVKLGCVGCPAGHCMHWLMPDWQLELGPDLWGLVNCLPQWQVLYSDHYKIQGSAFVASAGPSCYSSLEGHRHQQITHQIIPDIQLEQWLGLSCY